jgi:colanic acid biosynthesis glycosyl transferase WcaI
VRVRFLSEYFYPEPVGTGRLLAELARFLAEAPRKTRVSAFAGRRQFRGGDNALPPGEVWRGVAIRRASVPTVNRAKPIRRLGADLIFTLKAATEALRHRVDVNLVVTNPSLLPLACLVDKVIRGTPYVYVIHDLFPDVAVAVGVVKGGSPMDRVARHAQRTFLHNAASVVVLGRCMAATLGERYGLPQNKIEVIPNFPTLARVPTREDRERYRARHGWAGFICVYSGNLGQFQDFDTLLQAAKILQDDPEGIKFVFAGSGARREYVEQKASDLGLKNVIFSQFVPDEDFPDLLAASDAALITLERGAEGLGVPSKFYNLIAVGLPIVAVMGGATEISYVIEESDCGFVVPQGEPRHLAETIRHLARHPEDASLMGTRAKQVSRDRYDLGTAGSELIRVLESASRKGRHPLSSSAER